jgi:pimeloyl-ACP methyl ester carboxylesterase
MGDTTPQAGRRVMDGPGIVDVRGAGLCVDTTGDAADPAILLIGGMGASMDRRSAQLAGISMGGALAQRIALAHPERVDSLVLFSTSPAVPGGPELPPMSEELRAWFAAEVPQPDGTERAAVIDYLTAYERQLESAEYFDEARVRALVARIVDPSRDMAASMTNHAVAGEGEPAAMLRHSP